MSRRIFKSIFLTALIAVVLASAFILVTLYNAYNDRLVDELKNETGFILHALSKQQSESEYFNGVVSKNRLTLIASDGTVLFDNRADAETMENHADRPEIASALSSGMGQSRRYSNTLSEETVYYAVLTQEGNILRISNTQKSTFGLLWSLLTAFIVIIIGVAILSSIIGRHMSKRIVAPINALDLDKPLENDAYDELSPLLLRMEHQNAALRSKMLALNDKQQELAAITQNMREGLLLLNESANIISINQSAARVFGTAVDACIGNHILSLNRSIEMQNVVSGAQQGNDSESLLQMGKRYYQLLASPFSADSSAKGIILLILDVTDKQVAERSRREFTANVTHELKTPLTSILGYAEIMREGVAKPQDMRGFAGRIHDEATRLIDLVDDILRLSVMDEMIRLPQKQDVNLLALAGDVCCRLRPLAQKSGVSLLAEGESVVIAGIEKLLDEMLYNLCDNAIKYNTQGGSVTVRVCKEDGRAVIVVSDTGIGIPAAHQPHVFERFYRVDKSHSKQTGGTGLGLSIVKHVASIHDARIELVSVVGEGTQIKLTFSGASQQS